MSPPHRARGFPSSPMTVLTLLLSFVVAMQMQHSVGASDSSQGTLNTEALRKMHFRQAQPPGCKGPGEEGKGRWCEIMSDGGITVRNVERLREVVRAGEKKEASGKLPDGYNSKTSRVD